MELIRTPAYVQEFICTGSACGLTCCRCWTVTVDEETYRQYMDYPDGALRSRFRENIAEFEAGSRYARIRLDENGDCPFLNENRLCDIQLALGEKWLPAACGYPRRAYRIAGEWEMGMMLSCPESARLALFEDAAMRFVERAARPPKQTVEFDPGYPYELFRAIRDFMLEILQNRSYRMHERLLLLGIFIRRAMEDDPAVTAENTHSFRNYMRRDTTRRSLYPLAGNEVAQFELISNIIGEIAASHASREYALLLERCQKGLEKMAGGEESEYYRVMEQYAQKSAEWEGVLEHYFVNEVFRDPLPIAGLAQKEDGTLRPADGALWAAYLALCAQYLMISFHFACIVALDGALTQRDIIDVVNLFSRAAFGHDNVFTNKITGRMLDAGYQDVGQVAELVYF